MHRVGAGGRHEKRWPLDRLHTRNVERLRRCAVEEFLHEESGNSVIRYSHFDGEVVWGITGRITVNFILALGLG